jgi:hypothetical protein
MLSVIMLSVIMLSVIMLSVVMLNVLAPISLIFFSTRAPHYLEQIPLALIAAEMPEM